MIVSEILYFTSQHSLLSLPLLVIAAAIIGGAMAHLTKNSLWFALVGVGFVAGILNIFLGSSINALYLARYGTYGTAVITHGEQTSSQLNDQFIWHYDAVVRTADGRDVKTSFDTMSASLYPPRNQIDIPPEGERFVVKYIPGFARNIAIMRDESPFGRRELIRKALGPVQRARAQLEASPANPAFKAEYRDALQQLLDSHEADMPPAEAAGYRNELRRLDDPAMPAR